MAVAKCSNKTRKFPWKINLKINKELNEDFGGGIPSYVEVGPEKWALPSEFQDHAQTFYNFKVRPDDVWIMGFPRSGTNMVQSVAWAILHGLGNIGPGETIITKSHFLERRKLMVSEKGMDILRNSSNPVAAKILEDLENSFQKLVEDKNRRVIKTHLAFCILPPELLTNGCKVVYIARNPKDVVVSYYQLQRLMAWRPFMGDFKKFFNYFENDLICYSPYWQHIKQAWQQRHLENVYFIFYEDFIKDLRGGIKKLAKFLGKSLDDSALDDLENYFKFDNFKKINEQGNVLKKVGFWRDVPGDFIRKGKSGGWRDYFTEELNARADKWIEKNITDISDYKLPQL